MNYKVGRAANSKLDTGFFHFPLQDIGKTVSPSKKATFWAGKMMPFAGSTPVCPG
jgi:hypothetical protein